uniref:Uncharacterized protein n=1 Tax=Podoviridae sp. ct8Lf7 TaxID=2827723 RepID=A0A8S5S0U2_9CAUD|nr:MAG TPA: hypothetical protein [Podoviridae sp. ct8Lf7]
MSTDLLYRKLNDYDLCLIFPQENLRLLLYLYREVVIPERVLLEYLKIPVQLQQAT